MELWSHDMILFPERVFHINTLSYTCILIHTSNAKSDSLLYSICNFVYTQLLKMVPGLQITTYNRQFRKQITVLKTDPLEFYKVWVSEDFLFS